MSRCRRRAGSGLVRSGEHEHVLHQQTQSTPGLDVDIDVVTRLGLGTEPVDGRRH